MVSSLGLIVLREALSKPVSLDPRDGVLSGVKDGLGAAKDFGCDVVFVKLVDFARKELLSHISEHPRQSRRSGKRSGNTLQFGAFRLGRSTIRNQRHHHNSRRDFQAQFYAETRRYKH